MSVTLFKTTWHVRALAHLDYFEGAFTPNSPDQGPHFVTLYTFGPVGFGFTLQME